MNRSIRLLALLGALTLPAVAGAQSITGSISATADIATVFSFGAPSALSFGSVTPGTAATGSGYIPLTRNVGVIYSLPDGATTGQLTGPGGNLLPAYTCGVGSTTWAPEATEAPMQTRNRIFDDLSQLMSNASFDFAEVSRV